MLHYSAQILSIRINIFLLLLLSSPFCFSERTHQALLPLIPELKKWGKNSLVIKEVKKQNKLKASLQEIIEIDRQWQTTAGLNSLMLSLMKSPSAQALLQWEIQNGIVFETIVMDNQGATVAMTNKTSDYWHGDESKYIEAFNKGEVHISEEAYDESAHIFLVQVSVPVKRWRKTIGVITFGINMDKLK
jgi:hypothetical protein